MKNVYKETIKKQIDNCADMELLDLVFKLLAEEAPRECQIIQLFADREAAA